MSSQAAVDYVKDHLQKAEILVKRGQGGTTKQNMGINPSSRGSKEKLISRFFLFFSFYYYLIWNYSFMIFSTKYLIIWQNLLLKNYVQLQIR